MSSESSESDTFFSAEDIESTEFSTCSEDFSDSGSNSDLTASGRRSVKQNETEEGEVTEDVATSLNASDENQHGFDTERTSFRSLKDISPKDLNGTRKSSKDRQANSLTMETLSMEGPSIKSRKSQERPSSRLASSMNPLNESSTVDSVERPTFKRVSNSDVLNKPSTKSLRWALEGSSSRMASSLDAPLNGPSPKSHSSLNSVEGFSSRVASSVDHLKESSTGSFSFVDPLEGPSSRMASFLDFPNEPSTRRLSSLDPLKGPSSRMVSSLDSLNGPSSGSLSSVDPLEGPSSRTTSIQDPFEVSSTRRVSSMNPLEGPSTQTVWFSDPTEDSPASICKSQPSEVETNQTSENVPLYVFCLGTLSNFLRRASRRIRRSNCYLLLNMALLFLSFSAGYMGLQYNNLCNACPGLPMRVLGLGYFGVVMITFRIASILSNYHLIPPLVCRCFDVSCMCVFLPFMPFLMNVSDVVYVCDPAFSPSKANKNMFCMKVFYDYAYYLNGAIPLVIVLLLLIHIPGWFDTPEDEEQ